MTPEEFAAQARLSDDYLLGLHDSAWIARAVAERLANILTLESQRFNAGAYVALMVFAGVIQELETQYAQIIARPNETESEG